MGSRLQHFFSPSDRPNSEYTYQLISAQDLNVADDIVFLCLLEAASSQAGVEEISMRRTLGRLPEKIRKGDLPHLRVLVPQERRKLQRRSKFLYALSSSRKHTSFS